MKRGDRGGGDYGVFGKTALRVLLTGKIMLRDTPTHPLKRIPFQTLNICAALG